MTVMHRIETTLRLEIILRKGDWVRFHPSQSNLKGKVDGWFYRKYDLKTAEVLSCNPPGGPNTGIYVRFREDGYETEGALPVESFSLTPSLIRRNAGAKRRSRKKPR